MIIAILQARMTSTRLPGKVLAPVHGAPMIVRHLERLARCRSIDHLVVATSTDASDDPLAAAVQGAGYHMARGSLDDVLDRYYQAAQPFAPDHVLRLTGDCPLADPAVIDRVIDAHAQSTADLTATGTLAHSTWPDGLDACMMRFEALETAWREAQLPSEREHVVPFIMNRPDRFHCAEVVCEDGDFGDERWTVDEPEDLELVRAVYAALYDQNPAFGWRAVYDWLQAHPQVRLQNRHHDRDAGYRKSLLADQQAQGGR